MRRYILRFIARLTIRAPILVLSACAFLTLVAGIRSRKLFPVESDFRALLPRSAPEALTYYRALGQFGSFDYLIVVVETSRRDQQKSLIEVASRFAGAVRDYGRFVQAIEYAPDAETSGGTATAYPARASQIIPALLTRRQLDHLENLLNRQLEQQLSLFRRRMALPLSPDHRARLLQDPLQLSQIARLDGLHAWGPIHSPSARGLALSDDGRMLLMVLKPSRPATDLLFSEQLMRWLRSVARYAIETSGMDPAECWIGFVGSHAEAENDAQIVRRELAATLVASFLLMVLLFIVSVRRIGAVLFVGIPLAVGVLWTLGAASFFVEQIGVVTCAFGAALVGLGIAQAIHLYNRYLEERLGGAEVGPALETALCETGQGVVIGSLTTAVGFYGMYFTGFEAFGQLAIVGGTGILCCMAAMFLVLPPMVVLSERAPAQFRIHLPPSTLGLGRMAATVQNYPRLTLLVALIITAWLGFFAERIDFDENIGHLRKHSSDYEDLIRRMELRQFELPDTQILAIVSGPTLEDALYQNDLLYQRLEDGSTAFSILGYDSLRTALPSVRTQRETLARLRSILDLEAIEKRLHLIAKKEALGTTLTAGLLAQLQSLKTASADNRIVRFTGESDPAFVQLVMQYVYRHRNQCRVLTHIYPRQGAWESRNLDAFVAYLRQGSDAVEVTGLTFVIQALKEMLRSGMRLAVILVSLSVYLLLILHFRSTRKATVATLPVLCSVLWTLGTMQMVGMTLNFLNVLVIPLIIGLGIDNGVHILQRYYEGGRRDVEAAVEQSGRAVLITSLANILAFGTMWFASFQGMREIGLVAILGIGFALIAAILFVPAMLRLAGERLRLIDLLGNEDLGDKL